MTLDEQINLMEELLSDDDHWSCENAKTDYRQLQEWLKDYKRLLEMPKGDLISREALKKAIDDYAEKRQDTLLWQSDIEEIIDNAPTVEERLIHCKDCKHTVLSEDGKTLICCLTMKVGTVRPNFYCGNGEMKEVTRNE